MSKITITRTNVPLPQVMDGIRTFLFSCFDGFQDSDRKSWRAFWGKLIKFEPGEIARFDVSVPRNYKFLKKYFALLDVGFDAWEPKRKHKSYHGLAMEKNRDQFREDIIILAGFYEQTFDLRGRMRLRAKSISFANMDNVEFEKIYEATVTVLLREVLVAYKGRDEVDRVIEQVMGFA